jgi:ribonuclease G
MPKELIVSVNGREKKIAIVENGRVTEFYIERGETDQGIVGNIYKGRVMRVLPGMQSAFVDIGLERDAFLYVSDFFDEEEEFERIVVDKKKSEGVDDEAAARAAAERIERARIERERQAEAAQEDAEPERAARRDGREAEVTRAPEREEDGGEEEPREIEQAAPVAPESAEETETERAGGRRRDRRRRRGERETESAAEAGSLLDGAERDATPFVAQAGGFERISDDEDAAEVGSMFKDARVQERLSDQTRAVEFDIEPTTPTLEVGSLLGAASDAGGGFERISDDGEETDSESQLRSVQPEVVASVSQLVEEVTSAPAFAADAGGFERISDDEESGQPQQPAAEKKSSRRGAGRAASKRGSKKAAAASADEAGTRPESAEPEASTPETSADAEAKPSKSRSTKSASKKGTAKGQKTEKAATKGRASSKRGKAKGAEAAEGDAGEGAPLEDSDASVSSRPARGEFARRGGRRRRGGKKSNGEEQSNGHSPETEVESAPADLSPVEEVEEVAAPAAPAASAVETRPGRGSRDEERGADNRGRNARTEGREGRGEGRDARMGRDREGRSGGRDARPEGRDARPDARSEGRAESRADNRGDNRGDNRADNRGDNRSDNRGDNRGRAGRDDGGRGGRRERQPTITDLLREGQEIIVQIAKEPLGTKGARITSHIALPGRYLVYMPTIEHVGVSRKIESDSERARLRKLIQAIVKEEDVPSGGFIVRTAGVGVTEQDLRDDARYLARTWRDVRRGAEKQKAPAMVHKDLDLVQRILRDQLSEDFTAIRVDSEEEYLEIVEFVNRIQPRLVNRVKLYTRDEPILEAYGVQAEIDKAIKPRVWLKSGGYLVINQTEALVAIDVNTGKFVGRGGSRLEDTITKTNLEAVDEIARQIRLRDLGGILVLDLIDMEERRNRQKVLQALQDALREDKSPTKVLSFNDFGLVIMTRKRVKQSLERTLCTPCPYCTGAGLVKSAQTVCYEILEEARRLSRSNGERFTQTTLRVNPEVASALRTTERDVLGEIEVYLGPVDINADEHVHQEQFDFAFI